MYISTFWNTEYTLYAQTSVFARPVHLSGTLANALSTRKVKAETDFIYNGFTVINIIDM